MKTSIKLLTVVASIILMMSFTNKSSHNFIGTYGVSESDPSQIELTIHSDGTYSYQDFSNSDKKISVQGKWELKHKKVVLKGDGTNIRFHNVWTFDKEGLVAKSHRGLTFYRLCKLDR